MIIKNLKQHKWSFDEDTKELTISRYVVDEKLKSGYEEKVTIDRVRMFSLMRFMIRVMARLSTKRRKHEPEGLMDALSTEGMN